MPEFLPVLVRDIPASANAPPPVKPPPIIPTPIDGPNRFYGGDATIQDVLEWYCQNNPQPSQSHKAQTERNRLYGLLAAAMGDRRCLECRPHDLLAFINQFPDHSKTRKRWGSTFQRPFNLAAQLGLIMRNPFKGLIFPAGDEGRDWTFQEYQTVLRHAKAYIRRFIVFMRFSGMRPGEVRGLRWQDVRIDSNQIILEEHKTSYKVKKPRRIPLNKVLIKLLAYICRESPASSKYVFVNAYGRPWEPRSLDKSFNCLRTRSGLPKDVRLHGLRHQFATNAILNGVDVPTLAQILGHAHFRMTERYVHMAGKTDHLNEAMEQAVREQMKRPNHKPKGEST